MKRTELVNTYVDAQKTADYRGRSKFELKTNFRATHDTTTNPNLSNVINPMLSITDSSQSSLVERLGCSMYQNPMNTRVNISNVTDMAKVVEGASLPETVLTSQQLPGIPTRLGFQLSLSSELLPSYGQQGSWFSPVLTEMFNKAYFGALSNQVIALANALTPETGYEAATADVAMTRGIALSETYDMRAVSEDSEVKWLVASDVSRQLKNSVEDSGSGRFLSEFGTLAGTEILDSSRMTNQYAFLANWEKGVVINLPESYSIIVNPYSSGEIGVTNIICTGMTHIDLVDTATNFKTFQNLAIT